MLTACVMPDVIKVGASGALMGMFGAWFIELLCHWGDDTPSVFLPADEAKHQVRPVDENGCCFRA